MTETDIVVVCVDGSDAAIEAVSAGLALLGPNPHVLIATVVEATDPSLVTGAGHTGGIMSAEELDELDDANAADGRAIAEESVARVGVADPEIVVLRGDPGRLLCGLASERSARAIIMGSRGRGAIKRALLGSVSDYVVRNAPCPVIITGAKG